MDAKYVMQRYPIQVALDDGTLVTIRPLEKGDKIMLADFFQRIPEEDRFYLKENVTAPQVIHNWVEHMDLDRVVPLVAVLKEGDIVADATLHRSRAPARRHVGELRVVVEPDYRGMGLGARLIEELIDLGRALELGELFFELVDRRERRAIQAAVAAGFEEVAVLKERVRDMYGSLQDLIILELPLENGAARGSF